ncbi:MAG: gas vesicle protein [Planctomycetota bacterium]
MPSKRLNLKRDRIVKRVGIPAPSDSAKPGRTDAEITLADTLDRVLTRGIVAKAEVTICVAEIPLVYVGLQALVSSVETAAELLSPVDPMPRD